MSLPFFALAQISILAYAALGGVFLAFSDFIMRALAKTSGTGGVEAMQVINREVFHWVFMVLFIGMAPVSLLLGTYGAIWLGGTAGVLMTLAALAYLLGCFGVTVGRNVPMNEALAGMDLTDAATGTYWTGTYLPRWTIWNSVRTVACFASAALLLGGVLLEVAQ